MPAQRVGGTRTEKTEGTSSGRELMRYSAMSPASLLLRVREQRLRRVLEKIRNGPPHSVRDLARAVHLSPAHLQRLFKQETGVHIRDLLAESRLQNAALLLATSDLEVKEVAFLAGYQHHSSFVRAFQRRFGRTPKEYRHAPAA